MVAEVLVELKAQGMDQTFSYLIPPSFQENLQVGMRVLVPFGPQKLEGFVLEIHLEEETTFQKKAILELIDTEPVLNEELLKLGNYFSGKLLSSLVATYQTMLPTALKAHHGKKVPKKMESYLSLVQENTSQVKSETQKRIIELLLEGPQLKRDCMNISPSSVKTLLEKGRIIESKKEVYRLKETLIHERSNIVLTTEQTNAITQIASALNTFSPFLLHGVTGSGKTEIYMQLIEKVLKQGKEAIVLVPEISLTPQIVALFKKRFAEAVAILHSALSDGERYDEWRKIERQEVSIVIGARSAIFAPLTKLGLIIVDEEHSPSYKQENHPSYQAIEVALFRSQYHHCPLILGSATPSIESYTRAKTGIYQLIELKNRVHQTLPQVVLVDMKQEMKTGNAVLSKLLQEEMEKRLSLKQQILILLNRRGYTTLVSCHKCGYTDTCPNCEIPLTYHKASHTMRCHYCGYGKSKLESCPVCHSKDINEFGMGTQKLEEWIRNRFPLARTLRMDLDTTTKKGSHAKMVESFQNEEYDILIGTQMIAKGLDFPKVTLVGVIHADASLQIPDFRSAERTFQLLNQVAGRSGRGSASGLVIMQGFHMDHYSIVLASQHNYQAFYEKEMSYRKLLKYPPYYNLCLLKLKSKDTSILETESTKIASYLKEHLEKEVIVLGPNYSAMPKCNQVYSMQFILKYKKQSQVEESLLFLKDHYKKNRQFLLEVDLNPLKL